MKTFTSGIVAAFLLLFCANEVQAQGSSCAAAQPFCSNNTYQFPASTDTDSEAGPEYGCLTTQPNPAWYYLQVGTSGNIDITLENTMDVDIDFICWGPFTNLASACSNLTGSGSWDGCGLFESYPCGNIVDCSYDPQSSEEVNIPNAVAGNFYMMLITNYSGDPTDIIAYQSGGSGSTNCAIVPPIDCIISQFAVTINSCDANSTFSVNGTFTYQENPGTGTITVEVDNGTSTYTQTFSPPFVDGQVNNFMISGIPADGAASTISVSFSDDPSCVSTIPFNATANCDCNVDVGTYDVSMQGEGAENYVLCYGDQLFLNYNNDGVYPGEATNPPGPVYDPGVAWLVYSCPPSVGLVPSATEDVANDPCLITLLNGVNLTDINDLSFLNSFPAGTFTNNTIYFVPITMYSMQESVYSYVNTTIPCYELGPVYEVQYLPQITATQNQSCMNGTLTATISGGLPALDGSQYTVVPGSLTPSTATFSNTTASNGGAIVVTGLSNGQAYSFQVRDENNCPITVSGTFTGSALVNFVPSINSGCSPLQVTFTNTSPAGSNNCTWTFSDGGTATGCGNVTHTFFNPGCYDVTLSLTDAAGCSGQATVPNIVCVLPDPIAQFEVNPYIMTMSDPDAAMINTSVNATSYTWDFGDGSAQTSIFEPHHTFPADEPGNYNIMLVAMNEGGCVDTAYVIVIIEEELIFYVPNTFTPDGDEFNEVFGPVFTSGFDPYDYTLLIFDRWGEIIFESHDARIGWPGTYGEGNPIVQDGSYPWRIEFKTTKTDERKVVSGHVNVLR